MKKLLTTGLILLSLYSVSFSAKAPDFTVKDIHGKTHTLSKYTDAGQYVLIDLFATWCGPCKTTAPHLSNIYHDYGENGRQLVVLGISIDSKDTKAKMETFEANYGGDYQYPVIAGAAGGSSVGSSFYSAGIYKGYVPTIVLVEANTREVLFAKSGGKNKQGFLNILNTYNVPNDPVAIEKSPFAENISTGIIKRVTREKIVLNIEATSNYRIKMFSANGKVLIDRELILNSGENFVAWNGKNLASQIVMLSVEGGNIKSIKNFIVK